MTVDGSKNLGRLDYLILSVLKVNGAINKISAMTINEILLTNIGIKRTTIHKYLKNLIRNNYVSEAGKYGKEKMYYITIDGIKELEVV